MLLMLRCAYEYDIVGPDVNTAKILILDKITKSNFHQILRSSTGSCEDANLVARFISLCGGSGCFMVKLMLEEVPLCHSNCCFCESQGREQVEMDQDREQEVERFKMDLLRAVMETKRGAQATPDQRAAIQEAMVRIVCARIMIMMKSIAFYNDGTHDRLFRSATGSAGFA